MGGRARRHEGTHVGDGGRIQDNMVSGFGLSMGIVRYLYSFSVSVLEVLEEVFMETLERGC